MSAVIERAARSRYRDPDVRALTPTDDLFRQALEQNAQAPDHSAELWDTVTGLGGLEIREPITKFADVERMLQAHNRDVGGLTDRELDAIGRGEAGLFELHGKLKVIPYPRGAGSGAGAVYAKNLPAPGSYRIDPLLFAAKTSKNRKTNAPVVHPGYGSSFPFRADAVGILSRIILVAEGTVTSPAAAPVATRQWPWNIAKSISVSANGINALTTMDGLDARAYMRVRNKDFFLDRESIIAIPGNAATLAFRAFWEIPLAYDDSLIGAVFAQTEETFLNLLVGTATAADLFTVPGNLLAFNNVTWRAITEFYSIPIVDTKAGRVLVLPDITQLHGIVMRDDALTAPDVISPLTRTGGILLRTLQRIDNDLIQLGNVDPGTSVTSHRFRYGGNVVPLDVPGSYARLQNEMDYGDAILPTSDVVSGGAAPAYMVDDYVVDSPLRDTIHMAGITEAQMINTTNGVAPVAGSKVHTSQEAMVAG